MRSNQQEGWDAAAHIPKHSGQRLQRISIQRPGAIMSVSRAADGCRQHAAAVRAGWQE
jgi:hypothetical protein